MMTRDQAAEIRSRQLCGHSIAPVLLAEALSILRMPELIPEDEPYINPEPEMAPRPLRGKVTENGKPRQVLLMLLNGPAERTAFLAFWKEQGVDAVHIKRLFNNGFLRCEISLTEAGRKALL